MRTAPAASTIVSEPPQVPVARSPWRRRLIVTGIIIVALFALAMAARGHGLKKRFLALFRDPPPPARVSFVLTSPADGATNVPVQFDTPLTVRIRAGRSLDSATLNSTSVQLVRVANQELVPAKLSMPDPQSIAVIPASLLLPREQYALYVTHDLKTTDGVPVNDFLTSFTTAGELDPDLAFTNVELSETSGTAYTCVKIGPDGALWASSVDGRLYRFALRADGTTEKPVIYDTITRAENGPRLVTGFCFDPTSTAQSPILLVSHSYFGFEDVPDFTGKVSRIGGANLDRVEDLIIHLPRSSGDHATNQPSFGPDGALYIPQPSNTAVGAPDPMWNTRSEHLLNATILRLDLAKLPAKLPIDAMTPDANGTFDPRTSGSALTIYASGVRLAYDMLWHSSGKLFVAVNGASAGGNTPTDPNQTGTGLTGLTTAENDWLLDVKPNGFYGHPNPAAGHYVLNGGRIDRGFHFGQVPEYPVGTKPDPAYQQPLLCLGQHISANGMIEYRGSACAGKLDRRVLICRYARGSDILVLTLNDSGKVVRQDFGLPGLSNFSRPLDLTQHPETGNLYISEFGAKRITLARPAVPNSPRL